MVRGSLFLKTFLQLCEAERGTSPTLMDIDALIGQITVSREATIFNGRCDLLITAPGRFCILIENKIYASENDTQLARYRDWLSWQREPRRHQFLVFLTQHGIPAKNLPDGAYIPLSYTSHVRTWLSKCLHEIKAPHVRSTVEQYVNLVSTWQRKKNVKTQH